MKVIQSWAIEGGRLQHYALEYFGIVLRTCMFIAIYKLTTLTIKEKKGQKELPMCRIFIGKAGEKMKEIEVIRDHGSLWSKGVASREIETKGGPFIFRDIGPSFFKGDHIKSLEKLEY